MGAMEIAWYAGFMIAFLIGHLLSEYTDLSWHFILGTSTFIAVALFLARLGLPESPRWLWSVGRKDEARPSQQIHARRRARGRPARGRAQGQLRDAVLQAALAVHSVHLRPSGSAP